MRISAERDSPHYSAMVQFAAVLLNGVKQTMVVEADSDEGWVRSYVQDDEGNLAVMTEKGDVEILLSVEAAPFCATPNFIRTANWLASCGKEQTEANLSVQVGVHIEEMLEFIEQLDDVLPAYRAAAKDLGDLALDYKKDGKIVKFKDPVLALDALCDSEVTGNGVAYLAGWNKLLADMKVLAANDAKLVNGEPVILEGGTIGKPEGWVAADLSDCV